MPTAYRTILCPTDLSPAGDAAVDLAYALAAKDGTVHLLHVLEPAFIASPFDLTPVMVTPATPEALEAAEKKVTLHLKRLVPESALTRGVRTQTQVIHDVSPAAVIAREGQRLKADVIVVGTHGRKGLGRLLMGSVATEVAKNAPLPVILVRQGHAKK